MSVCALQALYLPVRQALWLSHNFHIATIPCVQPCLDATAGLAHKLRLLCSLDSRILAIKSDLAQIAPGKTYDDVDEILYAWVGLDSRIKEDVVNSGFQQGVFKQLCEKHGVDTVSMVIRRSINSEFKRKQRPFVIDIFNGNITEKNGKLF